MKTKEPSQKWLGFLFSRKPDPKGLAFSFCSFYNFCKKGFRMDYKLLKRKLGNICKADLPLNFAVYQLRKEIKDAGQQPGSDQWLYYEQNREYLRQRVVEIDPNLKSVTTEAVCHVFISQRKSGRKKSDEGTRDQLLRLIKERGSCECYWRHNFPGECSNDLHLDRLLPGKRGGTYEDKNVVISCGYHNISRGKKPIEEQVMR